MKFLLTVVLLVGCSFSTWAAETAPKKQAASAKVESKEKAPSAEAQAVAKTLTPTQKTKLLDLLNKGDAEALQTLPGIGPARAKEIVKSRPFENPVDLVKVDGIGDATLADIVAHAKAGFPEADKKEAPKKKPTAKKKDSVPDKKP
jgi:Holliday junction resolvasome RuvABC DNA-binding subunit